jgi:hypothetical protein
MEALTNDEADNELLKFPSLGGVSVRTGWSKYVQAKDVLCKLASVMELPENCPALQQGNHPGASHHPSTGGE